MHSHRIRLFVACVLMAMPAVGAEPTAPAQIERSCSGCHNDREAAGGLDLTRLPWKLTDASLRERWGRIHDRIQQGEMPPDAADLPDDQRQQLVQQLRTAIHDSDLAEVREFGRGPMRRLNRDEFQQNLRDILQLPRLDIRDMLPEDREAHHFNKTAAVLDMSRIQLAAYLEATESALRQAMASGIEPPASTRYHALATRMFQEAETFGNREAMFYAKDSKLLPMDGGKLNELRKSNQHDPSVEMALFRAASWPYYGYPEGFIARLPGDYKVRFSARAVVQLPGFELKPATRPQPMTFRARAPSGPDVSGDVRATGGLIDIAPEVAVHETVITLRKGETFEYSLLGLPMPLARNVNNGPPTYRYPPLPEGGQPGVAFQWIEVTGPIAPAQWPPSSHRVLFDDLPIRLLAMAAGQSELPVEVVSAKPREDAVRLLRRFAERAAHQPVPEASLRPYEQLILSKLDQNRPFAEAVMAGYKALLCSSHFLYLREPTADNAHFPIASRLSHFLTNNRPDDPLRQLAAEQKLRDRGILLAETDRLVASAGFERFIQNFTDYWLNLRHVRRDEPDIRLHPEYRFDDYLVESMEMETRAYVTAMVRENLPIRMLIDADFVLANDRLATHYGLPPMNGSAMRKISIPEGSPYGGLMTQGAILKVTSNGTSTSPVVRGAWIMDRLVGEPPPPPPASVPAVEPDIRGAKTIRDLLALHTKSASCANCHARFDPVGLALENFDILGGWRTRYRGIEKGDRISGIDRAGHDFAYTLADTVDASGKLRDGQPFKDVHDIKRLLIANPRRLARNLLHQFTVYSTGTPVRFSDRVEIEAMLDACASDGYRTRDLLHAFVTSRIFLGQQGAH